VRGTFTAPAVGARRQHAGVRCAPLRARGAGDCLLTTSQVASPSRNSSAGAVNSVCYPPPVFRLASENPERQGYKLHLTTDHGGYSTVDHNRNEVPN
jgi:hypothetical protein